MNHEPLNTYLRTYRKRSCLTQDEVAFLLGSMSGTNVLRHENGDRLPLPRTLLAYSVIFGVEVSEIYEGVFQEVQGVVRKRARGLLQSLQRQPRTARRDWKIAHVRTLLGEGGLVHDTP